MARKTPFLARRREAFVACSLLVLRALTVDPSRWWRDWVLVLAAYWAYTSCRSEAPEWPVVTATAMAYLLGIHILGQVPHVLAVLGQAG